MHYSTMVIMTKQGSSSHTTTIVSDYMCDLVLNCVMSSTIQIFNSSQVIFPFSRKFFYYKFISKRVSPQTMSKNSDDILSIHFAIFDNFSKYFSIVLLSVHNVICMSPKNHIYTASRSSSACLFIAHSFLRLTANG